MSSAKGFKEVFSKPNNIILMLFLSLLFYLVSVSVSDYSELFSIFRNYNILAFKLLPLYFIGFLSTISVFSAISLILICLLFGSYFVLAIYKTRSKNVKHSFFVSAGIFLGIIAPACAACGLGVASLLGIAGFIISLPFHGTEISIFAFLLLAYANWDVARKIGVNVCPSPK